MYPNNKYSNDDDMSVDNSTDNTDNSVDNMSTDDSSMDDRIKNYIEANPAIVADAAMRGRMEFRNQKDDDPDINRKRFEASKNMAWVALGSIIGIMIIVFFWIAPQDVKFYESILNWVITALSGMVLGYLGVTSYMYSTYTKSVTPVQKEEPPQPPTGAKG